MTDWARKYAEEEARLTAGAESLYQEHGQQAETNLVLRMRVAVKKYWEEKGRPLPPFDWQDPDAPPKAPRRRKKND